MKIIKVHEVVKYDNLIEGRGPTHIGYFVNNQDAIRAGEYYNGPNGIKNHRIVSKELVIYDTYDEHADIRDKKILDGLMSKLTAEEKRVIGLITNKVELISKEKE